MDNEFNNQQELIPNSDDTTPSAEDTSDVSQDITPVQDTASGSDEPTVAFEDNFDIADPTEEDIPVADVFAEDIETTIRPDSTVQTAEVTTDAEPPAAESPAFVETPAAPVVSVPAYSTEYNYNNPHAGMEPQPHQGYYQPPAPQPPSEQTWGYYGAPQPTAEPQKKKSTATKVFLTILFVIISLFAIGFFVLCGYMLGEQTPANTGSTTPTLFSEDSTQPTTPADDRPEEDEPEENREHLYTDKGSIVISDIPNDSRDTTKYNTKSAYSKICQSTVGIVCHDKNDSDISDPMSEGTGIIITEDGYIATNSHVIGDSRSAYKIQVVVSTGETYDAEIVGLDTRTDLAVLKIDANGLTPAVFADSSELEIGDDVIAVGNPGGIDFQNSLTKGVVSALDRELDLSSQVTYIQTDAAINPGNSGGPLCNIYGQVIGINTAKISASAYEGMGFAIPSLTAKDIIDDLMKQGYVSGRVRIGITGLAVTSEMAQYYDVPQGILIDTVAEDGPCADADLQQNDIITHIDGEEISSFKDVYSILATHKPGDEITLTIYRLDTDETFDEEITLMADEGETQN